MGVYPWPQTNERGFVLVSSMSKTICQASCESMCWAWRAARGGLDGRAFGPRHKPRCDSSRVPLAITHLCLLRLPFSREWVTGVRGWGSTPGLRRTSGVSYLMHSPRIWPVFCTRLHANLYRNYCILGAASMSSICMRITATIAIA